MGENFNVKMNDSVDRGILYTEYMSEDHVNKMIEGVDLELNEIIENFKKEEMEEKENPPVYNRKAEVVFKEIPTNLDNGMIVDIKDLGITIPAILDVKKCSSDAILTNGEQYCFEISEIDGETYIVNYLEVNEYNEYGAMNVPFSNLLTSAPKHMCSKDIGSGPKVELTIVGQTYNIEEYDKGIKFVIVNDESTYGDCFVLSSIRESIPKIEPGKKYAFNCLLHSTGLYAYDVKEVRLSSNDSDDRENDKFMGTVKFTDLPNPKKKTFAFKIITLEGEIDAQIDRYSISCDTLLCNEGTYIFSRSDVNKSKIKKYMKVPSESTDYVDADEVLKHIDEKIFMLECLEKEKVSDYAVIAVGLVGKPFGLIDRESEFEFYITHEKMKFRCIFDLKLNHVSNILNLDENKEYYFDGVLCADTVYIKDIYEKNNRDRQSTNDTDVAFARGMAKLSERKKDEIFRIIENGTKYDLIEIQSIPAFQSRVDIEKKYNLLKEYYPK